MRRPFQLALIIATLVITQTFALAADCRKAIDTVLAHEGGYQKSRADNGNWSSGKVGQGKRCGGTKYGISCAHNPGVNIKALTRDDAIRIYEEKECKKIRMHDLSGQIIPTILLDYAVNMGSEASIVLMRRTASLLRGDNKISLDPEMTDEDVKWFNEYTTNQTHRTLFYAVLILTAIDRYAVIVENNKKQAVWLLGWIRRAIPNEIEEIRKLESVLRQNDPSLIKKPN